MKTRLLPLCFALSLQAHETITTKLTWNQDISPILAARCGSCHRDGGSAPMALNHYEQARPWAKAIKEEVLSRRMPPWGAVKGFGAFRNDQSLSQEEIARIAEWVEGGAPQGDGPVSIAEIPVTRRPTPAPRGTLIGIRPKRNVDDVRVVAALPNGELVPLIWLHGYKAAFRRTFWLAEPLKLPANAIVRPPGLIELIRAR